MLDLESDVHEYSIRNGILLSRTHRERGIISSLEIRLVMRTPSIAPPTERRANVKHTFASTKRKNIKRFFVSGRERIKRSSQAM